MGRIFVIESEGRTYKCNSCKTQVALAADLFSREFFSRRAGKAYLFTNAINIVLGTMEKRQMLSGVHTIADIFCCCCGQIIGWKYIEAPDKNHIYKDGRFVLERCRINDGPDSGFYIDARPMSNSEDA